MNGELERLVRAQAGVITRGEALAVVSLIVLEHAVRSRQLAWSPTGRRYSPMP